jgi:excisionase family DNA binding protein
MEKEIHDLLVYLKLAVDDVRAKLSARYKPVYTVEEIADLCGRSAYTVRRWIGEGRIKAIRVAGTGPKGRLLVARDQLDMLVAGGLAADVPDAVVG